MVGRKAKQPFHKAGLRMLPVERASESSRVVSEGIVTPYYLILSLCLAIRTRLLLHHCHYCCHPKTEIHFFEDSKARCTRQLLWALPIPQRRTVLSY